MEDYGHHEINTDYYELLRNNWQINTYLYELRSASNILLSDWHAVRLIELKWSRYIYWDEKKCATKKRHEYVNPTHILK